MSMRNSKQSNSPAFKRVLVKHGLIEQSLAIPDAFEVFLHVGADKEVTKLRSTCGHKMPKIPDRYAITIRAIEKLASDKNKLAALKERLLQPRT